MKTTKTYYQYTGKPQGKQGRVGQGMLVVFNEEDIS